MYSDEIRYVEIQIIQGNTEHYPEYWRGHMKDNLHSTTKAGTLLYQCTENNK